MGRQRVAILDGRRRALGVIAGLVLGWALGVATARGQFMNVFNVPPDEAPASIESSTRLTLNSGGELPPFFDAGAADGSSTNVQVNLAGGSVGLGFDAHAGSAVNLNGGLVGDIFRALDGSALRVRGGEFRLDGVPIEGLVNIGQTRTAGFSDGTTLSGTLADGTPFAFSTLDGDSFAGGTLTLEVVALPAVTTGTISLPGDAVPLGVRGGQSLVVGSGAVVHDHFAAGAGSTVTVDGGVVGTNFEAVGATVRIESGAVGDRFDAQVGSRVTVTGGSVGTLLDAYADSRVTIDGGYVGSSFDAFAGSTVSIAGGTVDDRFNAYNGSVVNILGGTVFGSFEAFSGSLLNIAGGSLGSDVFVDGGTTVNISGGTVGNDFDAAAGSMVNLFGTQFLLDGAEIPNLLFDEPFTVIERNATLSGTLADGSPFSFELNATDAAGEDFFDTAATVTVTLIDGLPGDYNLDNRVNAADYVTWRNLRGQTVALPNEDRTATPGEVTDEDFFVWRHNFGRTAGGFARAVVPEPSAVVLAALLLAASVTSRRRMS